MEWHSELVIFWSPNHQVLSQPGGARVWQRQQQVRKIFNNTDLVENDFLFHDHSQSLLGSGGLFNSPERNFKYLGQHTHTHTFMLWVAIHVQLEQQGLVQAQLLRLTSPPSASTSLSLKFVWFCPRQSQNPRNWEDLCWKIMIYVEQIPPSAGSRDYCSHSIPA